MTQSYRLEKAGLMSRPELAEQGPEGLMSRRGGG